MTDKIIIVDFAGTLVKAEIIEEANEFRSKILERSLPSKEEHADSEKLYQANREFVKELTGVEENTEIHYNQNKGSKIQISGKEVQNQIATNLFQIGMYMVAKKHKQKIFVDGLIDELRQIKEKGYKLAIVSGVRTDIISGMLNISGVEDFFDYIQGQSPILGKSNEELIKELTEKGKIIAMVGDKLSDLEPVKKMGTKAIFVKWGHPSGGEEGFADVVVSNPNELKENFER